MIIPSQPLPGVEGVASDFYQSPGGLIVPGYVRVAGASFERGYVEPYNSTPLHVPEWVRDEQKLKEFFGAVGSNLDKINESLAVLEENGDSFETAIIRSNTGEAKKGVMLHISTYSSSISTNLGNAYELAVQAALYEDFDHVYVASPGNGGSSPIENTDVVISTPYGKMGQKDYFRKTGRTTYEDESEVKPLPYLVNMQQALKTAGIEVTGFIGTDSAGGSYATGLALAMEEGQVSHGFFSERSNFMSLGKIGLMYGMLVTENMRHGSRMRGLTQDGKAIDPLSIYAARLDDPSGIKDNKSIAEDRVKRVAEIKKVSTKQQLGAMVTSLTALARGPRENGDNPLIADVNAMLAKHPNGKFTFTLAEHDVLYKENAAVLAQEFLSQIDVQNADVKAMILEKLPHAYHTALPLLQDSLRRLAFDLAA
jgi:hypothetical protein